MVIPPKMPESLPTDELWSSNYGQTYEAQQTDVNRENGYSRNCGLFMEAAGFLD
jgi:hypothetical protein